MEGGSTGRLEREQAPSSSILTFCVTLVFLLWGLTAALTP